MATDVKQWDKSASNAELVDGALTGERDAWNELVRRYDGPLHQVAQSFRLDRAAADDAVQTTWLRLVEHLGTLHDPQGVGAWLTTTLRRHIVSTLRSRGRGPSLVGLDYLDVPSADSLPEDLVATSDRDARTRAALRRLPARSRMLLTLLMNSQARSYGEVSKALGMPLGSIGPTRARSLRLLRTELKAVGIDGA
jgi:RNA polymerase sigma factor (sigma-70 family)